MSDKKISDLVELTSLAADDVLPVVDASANATKRITGANLSNFPTQPTFGGNDVYHQGNVVGTVSQSGGTPTGAVIERDSNANGEYVKFADGTMICQQTFSGVDIDTTSDVTNLRYGQVTWTYPEQFAASPLVYGHRQGAGGMGSGVFNGANDEAAVRFWDNFTTTRTNSTCFAFAIGRWY